MNKVQRITMGISLAIVVLILTWFITDNVFGRIRGTWVTIHAFDLAITWWVWIISILLIVNIELFLFRKKIK